jgi:hypothetical protein
VTSIVPPAWCHSPRTGAPPGSTGAPVHAPGTQPPRRPMCANPAVARLGPDWELEPPTNCEVTVCAGEVANRPPGTWPGSPARVAWPTRAQRRPSAEAYPVTVSPALVSRSQRGTRPGGPAVSPV